MIKIAFFDVDGTILSLGQKSPTPKTIYALKSLQKNGIKLCLATGRGMTALPHLPEIDFDIYLTFNGSYVRDRDGLIFANPMDEEDKYQIIENLRKMGRPLSICNEKMVLANGTDPTLEEYFSFARQKLIVSDDFDDLLDKDIYQMMAAARKDEYDQILASTKNTRITAWWDRAVDIIPACGGKGLAIDKVLDYYGLERDEALAFGDGHNDIEMLEAVGTGIAMGNAKDEVKEHADYVCKPVDKDGIYYYLLENKLIEPFKK